MTTKSYCDIIMIECYSYRYFEIRACYEGADFFMGKVGSEAMHL